MLSHREQRRASDCSTNKWDQQTSTQCNTGKASSEWVNDCDWLTRANVRPLAQDREQTVGSDSNYWQSDRVNDLCIPCLTAQGSEQAQGSTEFKQAYFIHRVGLYINYTK